MTATRRHRSSGKISFWRARSRRSLAFGFASSEGVRRGRRFGGAMTAPGGESIRSEIFARLEAHLQRSKHEVRVFASAHAPGDPRARHARSRVRATRVVVSRRPAPAPPSVSRAQDSLTSTELYELVKMTAAFGVDGLPADPGAKEEAVHMILETELPPMRDEADDRDDAYSDGGGEDHDPHGYVPPLAALASTPKAALRRDPNADPNASAFALQLTANRRRPQSSPEAASASSPREREGAFSSPRSASPRSASPRFASPRLASPRPFPSDGTRRLEAEYEAVTRTMAAQASARREARAKPAWGGGQGERDAARERARRENRSPLDAARERARRARRRRLRRGGGRGGGAPPRRARRATPSTPRRDPGGGRPRELVRSSPALARASGGALEPRRGPSAQGLGDAPGAPRGDAIRGDPRRGHGDPRSERDDESARARRRVFLGQTQPHFVARRRGQAVPPRHAGHRGAARAFVRGWTGPRVRVAEHRRDGRRGERSACAA